jgi:L-fucose isomerase
MSKPNFKQKGTFKRGFADNDRELVGPIPTIALTPVVDGRAGAYDENLELTWNLVEKVYDLIAENVSLPDGTPVRVVVPPEIVYGARTGALAQEYYAKEGICANIFVSRSWAYSDELMSACQGIGSSEWVHAAYGLNQTDRPGAVWLKAFTAAMDEKKRPIFSIYNPDLEDETEPFTKHVSDRLLRFARCATAVGEMRGKNYLSVGGVSMGIIGSDVRRNVLLDYFGMGSVSVDMCLVKGRIDNNFYDHEEFERALKWFKKNFKYTWNDDGPMSNDELLAFSIKMTLIVRDLMVGNANLGDPALGKKYGYRADVEQSQGHNAIAGGTQGQRQWTDLYPNYDLAESILNSSFDWGGFGNSKVVATENDSKNAMGMLAAMLLSGGPQLFADIRTNWTADSIKAATGKNVEKIVPNGLIDKRNSGAGSLDYAVDIYKVAGMSYDTPIQQVWKKIHGSKKLQKELAKQACANTKYMAAILQYFPGDGLSSHYRSPGGIPMTAYRYNVVGDMLTCSVVEGDTVELPAAVADVISDRTNPTWPESYWVPRGMSSFEYMSRIGPNHDGNSFGLIGADMITLNAMLRIPVDMHNVPEEDIFRPTMWDRFGGDDFRACDYLGPLFG